MKQENVRFSLLHPNPRYQYTLDEQLVRVKRRQEFDTYISEDRHVVSTEDEGLTPPDPGVLLKTERASAMKIVEPNDLDTPLMSRKRAIFDENILIQQKFKPKPTTPNEVSDCSRALTPAQQLLVSASHQHLNFGEVSVFSRVTKCFAITNSLQHTLLVSLNCNCEELGESYPQSQVVPSRQVAGFDINFSSQTPCDFSKTIEYVLNGRHSYQITVSATVVPIDVQLSRGLIEFRFAVNSMMPFVKEHVTLHNRSNTNANFSWLETSPMFSLSVKSGSIEAHRSQNVEITYLPKTSNRDEVSFILQVEGGPSRTLKCVGLPGNPKGQLLRKKVDFGLIPLGIAKTQQFKIRNAGDDDGIFTISHDSLSELTITPTSGRIPVHDYLTLEITLKATHAGEFDIPVVVEIAGSPTLVFNVAGSAELPKVQLSNTEFDFGRLFVGSSVAIDATLSNVGAIPAILCLDLSIHPEFRIDFASELSDQHAGDTNSISLVSDSCFLTNGVEQAVPIRVKKSQSDARPTHQGLIYKIILIENSEIGFKLVYHPTEVNEHSFELPITLLNAVSASSYHLQRIVSAEAFKAPLRLSVSALDFGIAPLYEPRNSHFRSVVRSFVVTNDKRDDATWRLGVTSNPLFGSVFLTEPKTGKLGFNESQTILITFLPRVASPYHALLPISVVHQTEESLISNIELIAVGTARKFRLDITDVSLPIVPLNVESQMTIHLINEAFIEGTLTVNFAMDEKIFPLSVTFPEGNKLEHATQSLPVLVSFVSSHPLSFSTLVAILDNHGNGTSFTVTCTTDNSIFTLYPFFKGSDTIITSLGNGKPIVIESPPCEVAHELTSKFISVKDYLDFEYADFEPSTPLSEIQFVIRYLNALVINTQINDFPGDFIRSDGALLVELVTNLNGGKRPAPEGFDRSPPETAGTDAVLKRKEAIRKILASLQSAGALMTSVRPEFLLPRSDFLHLMRTKISRQLLGLNYLKAPDISTLDQQVVSNFTSSLLYSNSLIARIKVLEALYDDLSLEAWMMLMMQIFRVYVLGRIDGDRLHSVPGVQDALRGVKLLEPSYLQIEVNRPHGSLSMSNVFSFAECTLLKWTSLYSSTFARSLSFGITDFLQLRNAVCFGALISAHATRVFPADLTQGTSGFDTITFERNVVLFLSMIKDMKLNFAPTPEELIGGTRQMLLLTLVYFFETLPHYLPKTTLEFVTPLHKILTRTFSVGNQSTAEITYRAMITDTLNFTLPYEVIHVGPNSSFDFPVQFSARTVRRLSARLELIASRPRIVVQQSQPMPAQDKSATGTPISSARGVPNAPTYCAPIIVDITTDVSFQSPDQSFTIESPIYQNFHLQMPVKNILASRSQLAIRMHVCLILDANGEKIPQPTLPLILKDMIGSDYEESDSQSKTSQSPFDSLVKAHKTFVLNASTVAFKTQDPEEVVMIDVDFIPISLGTFRAILLFLDERFGEFVFEIHAKAVLPSPVEILHSKMKSESGQLCVNSASLDLGNSGLVRAIAYSHERCNMSANYQNERKFKDMLPRRVHEIELIYRQNVNSAEFTVVNSSPQYYEVPSSLTLLKQAVVETKSAANSLRVAFKPGKPGDYPCRILLLSAIDVRVLHILGIGLAATRELALEFTTAAGRTVKQDIPLQNPSSETWHYKISLTGDNCWTCLPRIAVKGGTVGYLTIGFTPFKTGTFQSDLTLFNLNKESTIIYKLLGVADEPPAEQKLVLNCQARDKTKHRIELRPFIKSGTIEVSTTVPIISFQREILILPNEPIRPFEFMILAQRSGLAAGTLTFTDQATRTYLWYVIEIHVDSPPPEEVIEITTVARKSATVSIPISNPKLEPSTFTIVLSDDDMFGDQQFAVPAHSSVDYKLVVSPLKSMKRYSSIFFYSEADGEFWYSIHIEATDPPEQTLAMLTSPIGRYASTFISLDNPQNKASFFRIDNDNPSAFQVISKRVVHLGGFEKKRIEIRYIPTTVGLRENATISFRSADNGDWVYKIGGTGKPPQPLSPIIVSASIDSASSAFVIFANPFPYPSRFAVSLSDEHETVFGFLGKRKVFTLTQFGEEFQIPFRFSPKELGQFKSFIIIASLGPARGPLPEIDSLPSVRWLYPIIGTALSKFTTETKIIHCRAQSEVEDDITMTLVGETDVFNVSEYSVALQLPLSFEFLRNAIDTRAKEVERTEGVPSLRVYVRFAPQRPLQCNGNLTVTNPLGQEWVFPLDFVAERGRPIATVEIESLLNKEGRVRVCVPTTFRTATHYQARFAPGSAVELRIEPEEGLIPISFDERTELPFDLVFAPKMYGKVLKGVLIVDTTDSQYLFDVVGKTPDYVPPDLTGKRTGLIDYSCPEVAKSTDIQKRKRNIIKENIERVKVGHKCASQVEAHSLD